MSASSHHHHHHHHHRHHQKEAISAQIYKQIEQIKAKLQQQPQQQDLSEHQQWLQRQNFQDLCHQLVVNDLDFTIDKKLEQDLWNLVFKSHINHLQSLVKKPDNEQHKANLATFLEAARGFYTKLLEDIVINYDEQTGNNNDLVFPFCQQRRRFDSFLFERKTKQQRPSSKSQQNEKQVLYMCQHILTHLGDIARYASHFPQAKSYYQHAIRLVPYLGHPYNQLGILYEMSRTNSLATVFYYVRSVAVRHMFPLAVTNLENFLRKLLDIPLGKYSSSGSGPLAHRDLIMLFLQVNALVYFDKASAGSYLELLKSSLRGFVASPQQRDKLADATQLCQMMAILFYMLKRKKSGGEQLVEVFVCLLEQLAYLHALCSGGDATVLPGVYLALRFITVEQQQQQPEEAVVADLFAKNKIWLMNNGDSSGAFKFCDAMCRMLNSLLQEGNVAQENVMKENEEEEEEDDEYSLWEDRMLNSFLPLMATSAAPSPAFAKYMTVQQQLKSDAEEAQLRRVRVHKMFRKLLREAADESSFVKLNDGNGRFEVDSNLCRNREETPIPLVSKAAAPQQQQQQKKRRQNVAISFMTQQQQTSPTPSLTASSLTTKPNFEQPKFQQQVSVTNFPHYQQQQQQQQHYQHQPNNNHNTSFNSFFFNKAAPSLSNFNNNQQQQSPNLNNSFPSSFNTSNTNSNSATTKQHPPKFPSFLPNVDKFQQQAPSFFPSAGQQQQQQFKRNNMPPHPPGLTNNNNSTAVAALADNQQLLSLSSLLANTNLQQQHQQSVLFGGGETNLNSSSVPNTTSSLLLGGDTIWSNTGGFGGLKQQQQPVTSSFNLNFDNKATTTTTSVLWPSLQNSSTIAPATTAAAAASTGGDKLLDFASLANNINLESLLQQQRATSFPNNNNMPSSSSPSSSIWSFPSPSANNRKSGN